MTVAKTIGFSISRTRLAYRALNINCQRRFTMAPATAPTDTRPVVISGPSGVGKGTLCKLLVSKHPSLFATSISHTTRDPRPGETRDVDYYYVTMKEFEDLIEKDGFVEHAKFGGNRYGTSKMMLEDMRKKGKVVVLDIEMEGVKQVKAQQKDVDARFVFVAPPGYEQDGDAAYKTLEQRLRGRGTEKEESIQKRLEQARKEIEYSKAEGSHDKIIINDDLDTAYSELDAFIFGK